MTLACVGTFALGWLLPRLDAFHQQHPALEVNVRTHNNVVNLAGEGIDYAIRFGTGPGLQRTTNRCLPHR